MSGEEESLDPFAIALPPVRAVFVLTTVDDLTAEERARYEVDEAGAVLVLGPDGALWRKFAAAPAVNELRQALLAPPAAPDIESVSG